MEKPISRQRKYQLKMKDAGRCQQCGKPLASPVLCITCVIKARGVRRKVLGHTPWTPGGIGRPIKYFEEEVV